MPRFDQHAARVRQVADRTFAEEVLVIPRLKDSPYLVGAVDGTISTYSLSGRVHVAARIAEAQRREAYRQDAQVKLGMSTAVFDMDQFTLDKPAPQEGWQLQLVDRLEQTVLRVASARPDGFGWLRCICEVVEAHGAP